MADQPTLDAEQLLRTLFDHEVDYVLIGGVAIQAYGHVRTTVDLDVIAAWTPENMRRLAAALGELQAWLRGADGDLLGIDLTDPRQPYESGNFLIRTRHGIWTCSRSGRPRARLAPTSSFQPARSRSRCLA
jgi:hypothetical protein